jgi:hypothetical protein
MKTLYTLLTVVAFSMPAFAQAEKKPAKKMPAEKAADKPAETKAAEKPAEDKAARALPMNSRADEIDAAGKTFTTKRKDGVAVKHVVTDKTEIKQGDAVATFGDIKVGDTVAGSRLKKSETEYEVVKITKFGPAKKKEAAEAKPSETKAADEKKK